MTDLTARATGVVGVGYQGRVVIDLIAELTALGVSVVFDVRQTPLSRKPGLSKNKLAQSLGQNGIEYVHLPELGNPKWNRDAYRHAGTPEGDLARANYREVLQTPAATEALDRIARSSEADLVALLCFEDAGEQCHRSQAIEAIHTRRLALLTT